MAFHTPKRESRPSTESLDCSPPMCDTFYPWNWGEEMSIRNVNLSPGSSCSSPEYREHSAGGGAGSRVGAGTGAESHRRGRPRADALTNLMKQGSTSPSHIKCKVCLRVFPREKSLQAHLRTHTGSEIAPASSCCLRTPPYVHSKLSASKIHATFFNDRGKTMLVSYARVFSMLLRRLLAHASRQSAIILCFKYLNGLFHVSRVIHTRLYDSEPPRSHRVC